MKKNGPQEHVFMLVRVGCFVLVVALLGLARPVQAQPQDCPFDPTEAVPDTLDPAGYFPLYIGTVREYVRRSGSFLESLSRREVIADTLIEGDRFAKLKVIGFDVIGADSQQTTIIAEADTSYLYRGVVDSVLFRWTPEHGKTELAQLFHDFYTCFDIGVEENAAMVEGGYDTTFTFQSGEAVALEATKEFTLFGVATEDYGYGVGLVRRGSDPSVQTSLTYARIDGQEYGTQLDSLFEIRVDAETPPLPRKNARLKTYPNPAYAVTHFALMLPVA